jgi:hypothetical protein
MSSSELWSTLRTITVPAIDASSPSVSKRSLS